MYLKSGIDNCACQEYEPQKVRRRRPLATLKLETVRPGVGAVTVVATSVEEDKAFYKQSYFVPRVLSALASFAVILGGYALAYWVIKPEEPGLKVGPEVTIFAFLYIAAQAIERALEPISVLIPSPKEEKETADEKKGEAQASINSLIGGASNAEALAGVDTSSAKNTLKEAAQAKDRAATLRTLRMMVLWGLASALGFLISAYLGLYLLDSVTADPTEGEAATAPKRWLDILVTGLAIGGGTKPLHDLITKIEKSKEKDEQAEETTTTTVTA
jgi:hypothetical protein